MEAYFKLKLIAIGLMLIVGIVMLVIACIAYVTSLFKHEMMVKAGFTYDAGLGERVAYEYQPRYAKGNLRIRAKDVYHKSFSDLRYWLKNN